LTAAARLIGDNIKFRPGTAGSGTLVVLFATGTGSAGPGSSSRSKPAYDAEANKPDTFRVTMKGNGALTYTNS
jgi:hypothetical protein